MCFSQPLPFFKSPLHQSVPGPDNRAQTCETNRESKFYLPELAESWHPVSPSSSAERLDKCDKLVP